MPVSVFSIIGDAVWIVAMSLIASGSRQLWRRLAPDVRVPMQWSRKRVATWRLGRTSAFIVMVSLPLAFGLVLSAAARNPANSPSDVLLVLLLRIAIAPLFVLAHYAWMRAAARTLNAEGALKP